MGVVCFHKDRNDIYFAQPDPDMQRTQIESIRFVEPANRSMFLQTYLSAELVYSEVVDEVSIITVRVCMLNSQASKFPRQRGFYMDRFRLESWTVKAHRQEWCWTMW